MESLQKQKTERLSKADAVGGFMSALAERNEPLTEFDNMLWVTAVESVVVHSDGRMTFHFFNDTEIDG